MAESKPILVLDFDGVIHSYSTGWQGAGEISDPPVTDAIDFIRRALEHFSVAIFSSRSNQEGGIPAMREWLFRHSNGDEDLVNAVNWPTEKPAAFISIDDRAFCFQGVFPDPKDLLAFIPWNKREPGYESKLKLLSRWFPQEMDSTLETILGRPNFWCGPIAAQLRLRGMKIPKKAELEQAHVIFWMIGLYLAYGSKWSEHGDKFLQGDRPNQ